MKAFLQVIALSLVLGAAALGADGNPAALPGGVAQRPRVRITTSCGPFVVELEPGLAPRTVENFLRYVKEGYFTDTIFHRVIAGFIVQGGGMLPNLVAKPAHEAIPNEAKATFKGGLKNTRGTLAMARKDEPDSATSEFYLNLTDNPGLDPRDDTAKGFGYCVFGHVVEGMPAVDKIGKVQTGWMHGLPNVPEIPVRIKSAEQLPQE